MVAVAAGAAIAPRARLSSFLIAGAVCAVVPDIDAIGRLLPVDDGAGGYTAAWHPIHGPFGQLFLCLLPLAFITRWVWQARGLPRRELAIEPPLTIGSHDRADPSIAPDAATIRRWVCLGLLVLLAFWGWRSEARLADARQRGARAGISR